MVDSVQRGLRGYFWIEQTTTRSGRKGAFKSYGGFCGHNARDLRKLKFQWIPSVYMWLEKTVGSSFPPSRLSRLVWTQRNLPSLFTSCGIARGQCDQGPGKWQESSGSLQTGIKQASVSLAHGGSIPSIECQLTWSSPKSGANCAREGVCGK